MDAVDHYRGQREQLSELFASLDDGQLATAVPGCPKWTVKDVLGHLVGETADVCGGNMDGAGGAQWTQAQVDARNDKSAAELVEEWTKRGVGFEAAIPEMGGLGTIFGWDITMHGDDVKEALGLPLGTSATHAMVLDGLVAQAGKRAEGIGTLTLRVGDREWTIGSGEPAAAVAVADAQELARVVGGRRTDEQVRDLDWTGDPEPWLPVLPLFRDGR